jgi:hypothetical protein
MNRSFRNRDPNSRTQPSGPKLAPVPIVARSLRRGCEYLILAFASGLILSLATGEARDAGVSYEPADLQIISGIVTRMEALPRAGAGRDVTLVLRTDIGDEVQVAVAPRRVLKAMGLRLRDGDAIQVAGWRIVRGKPALLAAEISTGTQLFRFRDRHGTAVWEPRRRRARPLTQGID